MTMFLYFSPKGSTPSFFRRVTDSRAAWMARSTSVRREIVLSALHHQRAMRIEQVGRSPGLLPTVGMLGLERVE